MAGPLTPEVVRENPVLYSCPRCHYTLHGTYDVTATPGQDCPGCKQRKYHEFTRKTLYVDTED